MPTASNFPIFLHTLPQVQSADTGGGLGCGRFGGYLRWLRFFETLGA